MAKKMTYKNAGVDIDKTDAMIDDIKVMCSRTKRKEVLGNIGNFGGFFRMPQKGYKDPILVASTDGVGTKLLITELRNDYSTIGIDLVAMSVNDVVTCGAEPLLFLDYFATGKVNPKKFNSILSGMVKACKETNCSLIGGEIAEMPDCYAKEKYDLAGFCVGVVDRQKIIDGAQVKPGDVVLGLASSGLHSNGYSLARKVFTDREIASSEWGALLLKPTVLYVNPILNLLKAVKVKSVAHITGGGLYDNIPRVLSPKADVIIYKNSWPVPRIFKEIQKRAGIEQREMCRTFNMGVGMVVVIARHEVEKAQAVLKKCRIASWVIGHVARGSNQVHIQ